MRRDAPWFDRLTWRGLAYETYEAWRALRTNDISTARVASIAVGGSRFAHGAVASARRAEGARVAELQRALEEEFEAVVRRARDRKDLLGSMVALLEAREAFEDLQAARRLGGADEAADVRAALRVGLATEFLVRIAEATRRTAQACFLDLAIVSSLTPSALARMRRTPASGHRALARTLAKLSPERQEGILERYEARCAEDGPGRAERYLRNFVGSLRETSAPVRRVGAARSRPSRPDTELVDASNWPLALEHAALGLPPELRGELVVGGVTGAGPRKCESCGGSDFALRIRRASARSLENGELPALGWEVAGLARHWATTGQAADERLSKLRTDRNGRTWATLAREGAIREHRLVSPRGWPRLATMSGCVRCTPVDRSAIRVSCGEGHARLSVTASGSTQAPMALDAAFYPRASAAPDGDAPGDGTPLVLFTIGREIVLAFPVDPAGDVVLGSLGLLALHVRPLLAELARAARGESLRVG